MGFKKNCAKVSYLVKPDEKFQLIYCDEDKSNN